MPASAMTRSLPRPSRKCGRSRPRANWTSLRSSNRLCGVDEQIRRPADAHRREAAERLVPRRLDPDPPLDLGAGRDRVEGGDHGAIPRDTRSIALAVRQRPTLGGGHHELGDRVGGGRPPQCAGRGRHREVAGRVVEDAGRLDERVGVERLVLDQPGGPRVHQHARVGALVARRVGIRDHDHRHAERGDLRQGRGAGAPDHEVRGRERGEHVVAQERVRPVAGAHAGRQGFPVGERRGIPLVAGHMDDRDAFDEPPDGARDRGVEPADGLRAAEDQEHALTGRHAQFAGARRRGPRPGCRGSASR